MRIQVETAAETVADFYKNGEILLTGGTGFMGKLMIDKILRSFPDINNIYLMVRNKRGLTPEERVEKIFKTAIFDPLNREVPDFRSKIKLIPADIESENLGLSPENKKLLLSKVNIVFHCAASVRFDEELQIGVKTNLYATSQMLNLAKQCPHLKMFIYVSTAFSHFKMRTNVEEKLYKPDSSYRELIQVLKLSPNDPELKQLKKKYSKENANTYCLTKAASEELLSEEGRSYPVCIFRPSIVISTAKDPIPGWIDNLYGPTGLVCGAQAGIIRSVLADPDVKADIVPVDFVANALVCAPWDARQRYQKDNSSMPVYNYVSSKDNPITWSDFSIKSQMAQLRNPSSQGLWHCFVLLTRHRTIYCLHNLLLHYLFGYIFDTCAWISGNKFRLLPIYDKMGKVVSALEPFSTKEWIFDNHNVQHMWNQLSPFEQNQFPFNIESLNWDDYLDKYVQGLLVHHLNDKMDLETRKKAKKRYKRLTIAHQCVKSLLYVSVVLLIWSLLNYILWRFKDSYISYLNTRFPHLRSKVTPVE
uniref:Fatty acyl-CoA reductase n=1 Tax=Cacopsylla melanoneura TaxID=428564 RepID=A0A8D9ACD6_9HEMI